MSNKLPKNKKGPDTTNKDTGTIKTLFSFNPIGDKVFSVYENSKKKESAIARKGVNNIISIILIMAVAVVAAYTKKSPVICIAVILMAAIETSVSIWKLHKGNSKKIWVTAAVINVIYMVTSIIIIVILNT